MADNFKNDDTFFPWRRLAASSEPTEEANGLLNIINQIRMKGKMK